MNMSRITGEPEKPFHSSAYAEVASGDSMGSTSSQSFNQRTQIDRDRQAVRKYRDSHVGRALPSRSISSFMPVNGSEPEAATRQQQNTIAQPIAPAVPPRTVFKEPSGRTHNPFS